LHSTRMPLIWSLIHIAIVLLTFTPLGLITAVLLMVPMIIVYTVTPKPVIFAGLYGLSLALSYAIGAGLGGNGTGVAAVLLSLFFIIPSIVIGLMYKKGSSALGVLTSGTLAMLAQLLVLFLLFYMAGINVTGQLKQFFMDSMEQASLIMGSQVPEETVDLMISLITQMVPLYMIMFSVFYVLVSHGIARYALQRAGQTINGLPPLRKWRMPKSLVWYYLAALIASFFMIDDTESTLAVMLVNLIPLLMIVFAVQALSFLSFVGHLKGWSKGVRTAILVGAIVLYLILPPIPQVLSLLGVFDTAMPIRERLINRQ
jgi:uncharacterized protein YybS (DUF2232 family)